VQSVKERLGPDFIPITSSNFGEKYGRGLVLLQYWLAFIILIAVNYPYIIAVESNWLYLILLPFNIYGNFFLFALIAGFLAWIDLKILRFIEPPKEGIFPLDGREFKYYCRRFRICYYAIYIFRALPLPWADMVAFKMFGVKVGKNVVLYDAWMDSEFIEVGDFVMLSLNSALISHCIYQNKFLVRKVIIKKNAIVGAESVVAPGTIFEEGAILGGNATTLIGQHLEAYATHVGNPISRILPVKIKNQNQQ
jgi:acetyltransferase-like isoleucine patch superfamily enzyme